MREKNIFRDVHYCGGGFKGRFVNARGLSFCGFCGKEKKKLDID